MCPVWPKTAVNDLFIHAIPGCQGVSEGACGEQQAARAVISNSGGLQMAFGVSFWDFDEVVLAEMGFDYQTWNFSLHYTYKKLWNLGFPFGNDLQSWWIFHSCVTMLDHQRVSRMVID